MKYIVRSATLKAEKRNTKATIRVFCNWSFPLPNPASIDIRWLRPIVYQSWRQNSLRTSQEITNFRKTWFWATWHFDEACVSNKYCTLLNIIFVSAVVMHFATKKHITNSFHGFYFTSGHIISIQKCIIELFTTRGSLRGASRASFSNSNSF